MRRVRRNEGNSASEEACEEQWYTDSFVSCVTVYALVVLGHARHVDVHTAGHAPGVVHPGVLALIPETGGNVADIVHRIFRTDGAVVPSCYTNLMYCGS